jgi:hypothetical protein
MSLNEDGNAQAQRAWNANAEFWDERMAEGNEFFNFLGWPAWKNCWGMSQATACLTSRVETV